MPYIFGIVSLALLVFCIVHAIKNNNAYPWIFLLIFLTGIGSLIYVFIEVLPGMMRSREVNTLKRGMTKVISPNKDLAAARRDVELIGSVDAKRRLADEYVARGQYDDAIALYHDALTGVHRDDPALLFALAKAYIAKGDGAGAQTALDDLQAANPQFTSSEAHLVYARALELQGKGTEALDEYARVVRYFAGEEARCRYALLLERTGDTRRAREVFSEILKLASGTPRHYRSAQRAWIDTAKSHLEAL